MRINTIKSVIFLIMIFSSVASMFLLLQVDGDVKTLDNYGLTYNAVWSGPFSKLTLIAFGLFMANTVAASIGLLSGVKSRLKPHPVLSLEQESELKPLDAQPMTSDVPCESVAAEAKPFEVEKPTVEEAKESAKSEEPALTSDSGVTIQCPSCARAFNRPLLVLDFRSGKFQLINVCPYCRQPLQDASDDAGQTKNQ